MRNGTVGDMGFSGISVFRRDTELELHGDECVSCEEGSFGRNILEMFYNNQGELVTMARKKRGLRELADNGHLHTYRIYDPAYDIVWKKCGAYFAGDRTAREMQR